MRIRGNLANCPRLWRRGFVDQISAAVLFCQLSKPQPSRGHIQQRFSVVRVRHARSHWQHTRPHSLGTTPHYSPIHPLSRTKPGPQGTVATRPLSCGKQPSFSRRHRSQMCQIRTLRTPARPLQANNSAKSRDQHNARRIALASQSEPNASQCRSPAMANGRCRMHGGMFPEHRRGIRTR